MSVAPRALSTANQRVRIRSRLQTLVLEHIPEHSDFVVADERDRILREMDPLFRQEAGLALLADAVHQVILNELHSRRSIFEQKVTKSQKRFDDAIQAYRDGDDEALNVWKQEFVIDKNNTRRCVADMVRRDLLFVADDRAAKARRHALRAAFFRGLASRMPDEHTTVQEVMDEVEYAQFYRDTFAAPPTDPTPTKPTRKK